MPCMPFIEYEILSKKCLILSISLSYHLFYHTYVRCKSLQLTDYVSFSFFNCILIVFVCLSLYLSFFWINLILSIMLCNLQFYHTFVRWKPSILSEYISSSFFNCILSVFVCLSLQLSFFSKNLQCYKLSYVILNFNIHMLEDFLQFYRKMAPLPFSITF